MFALLEHAAPDGLHWDLLIELPGRDGLATWRLDRNPLAAAGPIAATRIADHRRAYLEYEGEISGNRGVVRRLDRGDCTILDCGVDRLRARFAGDALRGEFEIDTTFRRAAGPPPG